MPEKKKEKKKIGKALFFLSIKKKMVIKPKGKIFLSSPNNPDPKLTTDRNVYKNDLLAILLVRQFIL